MKRFVTTSKAEFLTALTAALKSDERATIINGAFALEVTGRAEVLEEAHEKWLRWTDRTLQSDPDYKAMRVRLQEPQRIVRRFKRFSRKLWEE